MCGGLEQSNAISVVSCQNENVCTENGNSTSAGEEKTQASDEDASDKSSYLLELAANNELDRFRQAVEEGKSNIDAVGSWYSRHNGTSQMVLEERTPVMIAALYGSLDVLKYIVDNYTASGKDINRTCGTDGTTALHCAAAGGSICAVDAVKLLVDFGAKRDTLDAKGRRPADVIGVSPRLAHVKVALEKALKETDAALSTPATAPVEADSGVPAFPDDLEDGCLPSTLDDSYLFDGMSMCATLDGEVVGPNNVLTSSCLSSLPEASASSPFSSTSPSSSPKSLESIAGKTLGESNDRPREYPIDPNVPDIKNILYGTDEFRMFSFKVRPCSRAYSHDWTECPFVHPGENARRRDPRRYHYSCVPCPDFRKGACRRGDACEYAHGVFECWLHPAQYRTRLCKDGTGCSRRVCFFAHTIEELRPLHVSTGSAIPSLRTTASLDMGALSPPIVPGSPSSVLMGPPFSPSNAAQNLTQGGLATPPLSPSALSTNSLAGTWSQPNVPALHLPGGGLQASRLRAALNARDISFEELSRPSEFEVPLMNDFTSLSSQALAMQARLNAAVAASACGTASSHAGKHQSLGLSVAPTNLDDLFASELATSPRSAVHDSTPLSQIETHNQSHKTLHLQSQLQSQVSSQGFPQASGQMQLQLQQTVLDSPRKGVSLLQSPKQMSSFSLGSLSRTLAIRRVDSDRENGAGAPFSSAVIAARAAFAQRDKRSHSSRDLGAGLILSDWGSPTGKPEWGVQGDDLCKFRKSASFGVRSSEGPDLSWVQKLVKEGPSESDTGLVTTVCFGENTSSGERETMDTPVIGPWIEKTKLDRIVA